MKVARGTALVCALLTWAAACDTGPAGGRYDFDGDGVEDEADCDPADPSIFPGAFDPYGDGIDQDCDGSDGVDRDGDGHPAPGDGVDEALADCDDRDAEVHPGASEVAADGIDSDCDGADAPDRDGDGTPDPDDCDPDDAALHEEDADGDGVTTCDGDCDDTEPAAAPGRTEVCDGIDNDCNGWIDVWDTGSLGCARAVLVGEAADDAFGRAAVPAGDTDADGYPDLWISSRYQDSAGEGSGTTYLVQGPFVGDRELGEVVRLTGAGPRDASGWSLVAPGDVDGDGIPDLWVSAPNHDATGDDAGAVHLVRGPFPANRSLGDDDATLLGEAAVDYAGYKIAGLGDLNGDGLPDLAVGAPGHDAAGDVSGAVYVIAGPFAGDVSLADAECKLTGALAGDQAGVSLAAPGDVDGDGHEDLLVGTWREAGGESGGAYLVLGPCAGTLSLADSDAHLAATAVADGAGYAVAGPGDLDGDGLPDLVVAVPEEGGVDTGRGAVYVVPGTVRGVVPLAEAGHRIEGTSPGGDFGEALAGGGDVDGDGTLDLWIGASWDDSGVDDAGAVYLYRGPIGQDRTAGEADARFVGEATDDRAGRDLAIVGDIDGDGLDDLAVNAPLHDTFAPDDGALYLVLGHRW